MGNKSLNKAKNKDESKIITNKKRKKELICFLLPNLKTDKDPQNQIENKSPFLPFTSRFDKENDFIDSHFILISNDIILIPTKHIYKEGRTPFYFSFPLNINKVPFDKYNLIIENENYNNKYSIIKVLKYNFLFKNYFDIPNDTFNIESNEKYFINEKDEEELFDIKTLNCKDNNKKINSPWSPIFIKRDNKLYIIGIITEKCEPKIFNKGDLSKIKEKIENVEVEFKFQFKLKTELKLITKLDFNKQDINDEEMNFFFQYDFTNLEYLDLQNKHLTDKGIKSLQNKSLSRLKYLNLSNNDITDVGLTYLNELSSLNELVLLNMNKLTDDYFLSLEKSGLISKLKIFKCDKTKLTFRYLNNKYTEFNLPNLNSIKIANNFTEVHRILTDLFLLDKLSSRIKILDLSNTGLTDNGMLRLTKNIHYFKNLESINLENSKVTACSLKYFKQIQEKNIKITPNITNIPSKVRKRAYNITLGGSTYSGKTSYLRTYFDKEFNPDNFSTTGGYYIDMDYPKLENTKVKIYDTNRWIGIGEHMVKDYIRLADGIILLFDLSKKEDFENIPYFLTKIAEYFELEEFPILLVGNKADLEKKVKQEEIDELSAKKKFIGYFEVSCKNLTNVDESFSYMLDYIREKEKDFPCPKIKKTTKKKKEKK